MTPGWIVAVFVNVAYDCVWTGPNGNGSPETVGAGVAAGRGPVEGSDGGAGASVGAGPGLGASVDAACGTGVAAGAVAPDVCAPASEASDEVPSRKARAAMEVRRIIARLSSKARAAPLAPFASLGSG